VVVVVVLVVVVLVRWCKRHCAPRDSITP